MKKITLCFFILGLALIGQAQVSKTINITTAGTLSTALTSVELNTVTNLTITGTIDARDFVPMRDAMPALAILDLSGVTIAAYNGSAGPYGVKAFLSPAIKTSAKTELDDPLNRIRAQQIKMQVGTVATTFYPANKIPQFAFCNPNTGEGKASLKSIIIPSSVTSIGHGAFEYCSGLTSVTIPSSVTSIGEAAFMGCSGLTSVTIPSSVYLIGIYAFGECSGLTSVTIPSSVTSIGSQAFFFCNGLTSINVETTNQNYSGINGVLFDKNQINLIQYPGGKTDSYTIPSSVTSIGYVAFATCSGLTSITIPSSVTTIGDYAFEACSGLTSINVETTNQNYSSINGVLFDKNQINLIQYPGGKTVSYYTIPSSVTTIGSSAFEACSGLTSVTIPSSVTSIGSYAFWRCSGLTSISIPSSVTTIGISAFYSCSGLTSVTIPSSVTSIGDDAFDSCSGLTSVTIPSSVTTIGSYAFWGCSGLTSINVETTNQNYSGINGVLFDKNQINLIEYPGGKTGSYTIPSSVSSIGSDAFGNCTGLSSVTIPSSVSSIGSYAFEYCSGLTSIYAYSTVPVNISASYSVFYNVNNTTCILYVPIGSKSLYQAAYQWKDFTNIVEMTTAVPTLTNESISISPNPVTDGFRIKGIEGTSEIRLTDLNGKVLLTKQVTSNETITVNNLPQGIYIVKIITDKGITERKLVNK